MNNMAQPGAGTESGGAEPDGTVFVVRGYGFAGRVFRAEYVGVVNGAETVFTETVDFAETGSDLVPSDALQKLLALALSLSYYKATFSGKIRVEFPLTDAEKLFYAELIKHGMGEYAFVNNLPWKLTPEIDAGQAELAELEPRENAENHAEIADKQPLVAVGGGKDSIVTIEALKHAGFKPVLFAVGDKGAIRDSVRVSGLDFVTFNRKIDPQLIAANQAGAPNGHVPVTAMNSVIALIAAEIMGLGAVIFSNEQSANYGNTQWSGIEVNHQWSKSLEFEYLLRDTLAAAGRSADSYFSLLRGFRELDIARSFATHPQYFDAFTSCNKAYLISAERRVNGWCGECPKCQFVFLILAPFIGRARLTQIFGVDILADAAQKQGLVDILGIGEQKPFECVGEPSEAAEALALVVNGGEWADSALVAELAAALSSGYGADFGAVSDSDPVQISDDRVPVAYLKARDFVAGIDADADPLKITEKRAGNGAA
ncbi:MAG: hypothetical protein Q4C71_01950 [Microbacteriaceae bacterium]|nr:hypothetical protein [Microbacteriaceae bacterium]